MPVFSIDGEPLSFSGPVPASLDALVAVVEPVLAERGRVLAQILADGVPWDDAASATSWDSLRAIDIVSVGLGEAIAQVAEANAAMADALMTGAAALACEVLCVGWSDVERKCLELAGRLSELLQNSSGLSGASPAVSDRLAGLTGALDRWLTAVEARDAAGVCIRIDREVLPALAGFAVAARGLKGGA